MVFLAEPKAWLTCADLPKPAFLSQKKYFKLEFLSNTFRLSSHHLEQQCT